MKEACPGVLGVWEFNEAFQLTQAMDQFFADSYKLAIVQSVYSKCFIQSMLAARADSAGRSMRAVIGVVTYLL